MFLNILAVNGTVEEMMLPPSGDRILPDDFLRRTIPS